MVCLALGVAALSACGGGDKKITYEGGSLTAVVGEASSATVATATGADGITYALKDGSSLPSQLTLGGNGGKRFGGSGIYHYGLSRRYYRDDVQNGSGRRYP